MSKSNLIAFRLPAELQTLFNDAVSNSGSDKTAWIVSAIKEKLNRPDSNPDARILSLVERLESSVASLIAGKADIPPYTYNESAVVSVVNSVLSECIRQVIKLKAVKHGIRISILHRGVIKI